MKKDIISIISLSIILILIIFYLIKSITTVTYVNYKNVSVMWIDDDQKYEVFDNDSNNHLESIYQSNLIVIYEESEDPSYRFEYCESYSTLYLFNTKFNKENTLYLIISLNKGD